MQCDQTRALPLEHDWMINIRWHETKCLTRSAEVIRAG